MTLSFVPTTDTCASKTGSFVAASVTTPHTTPFPAGGGRDGPFADLTKWGTTVGWLSLLPCPPLLIADLGDPKRFHHMLRVFKPGSPMSVGTWTLLTYSGAATAGRLSELMGLTSGAVTRVIDRLEQAGYVRRVPDAADRRRVVVELVPEKMAALEATMGRLGEKGALVVGRYTEAELTVINDFLTRMAETTRDEAKALRDAPDPAAGSRSEHAAPIGALGRAVRNLERPGRKFR